MKNHIGQIVLISTALMLILTACAPPDLPNETAPTPTSAPDADSTPALTPDLTGSVWQLTAWRNNDGAMTPLASKKPITLEFTDDMLGGNGGCNRYFTHYELNGDKLHINEAIGSTMMACPQPIMAQEQNYLTLLPQAVGIQISDDMLELLGADGAPLLTFTTEQLTGQTEPEATLIGPVWAWQGTQRPDDSQTNIQTPGRFSIQFQEDGSVHVVADCKTGVGRYTADANTINIDLNITSPKECADEELVATFLEDLTFAGTWFIDENQQLFINLQMDGGDMRFVRLKAR